MRRPVAGAAPPGVAAFDFDGTLIAGDSFLPFLSGSSARRAGANVCGSPARRLARAFAPGRRDATKAALCWPGCWRLPADRDSATWAQAYGADWRDGSARPWPSGSRGTGNRAIGWSSSPPRLDVYLGTARAGCWASTGVWPPVWRSGDDGLLTGRLQGANVRRAEKAARLRQWLAGELAAGLTSCGPTATASATVSCWPWRSTRAGVTRPAPRVAADRPDWGWLPRALITGVTGQDGSYLAEFLLDQGYEVIGMVRRSSTPTIERIAHLADRLTLVPATCSTRRR